MGGEEEIKGDVSGGVMSIEPQAGFYLLLPRWRCNGARFTLPAARTAVEVGLPSATRVEPRLQGHDVALQDA